MSNKNLHILPHDKNIKIKPGKSLIESLMNQGIFLRSDCGGKGICGKCRVKKISNNGDNKFINSCTYMVSKNLQIEIPESSMQSCHILNKAPVSLPEIFTNSFKKNNGKKCHGVAVDLGTTTIAIYLINTDRGKILSSLAIKNPQSFYGDDVMSRISAIGQEKKKLRTLQKIVVKAIEWGIKELLTSLDLKKNTISQMVAVGNPTMIHILTGIDPKPIGISPHQPAFYEAKSIQSNELGFKLENFPIQTLPQVSGFIGGDILSAAIAIDLENKPDGTLLVDLGTNGELVLKVNNRFYATSCATGPAFEGACLSCGMQAIPGAITGVHIKNLQELPEYTFVNPLNTSGQRPAGICGTGIISAVAQLYKNKIIKPDGAFTKDIILPALKKNSSGKIQYIIVPEKFSRDGSEIFISQKDIRSVQLGKAALSTAIKFLLKKAKIDKPEKIIIAGALGTFLDKNDMITLGMIPSMAPDKIETAGNLAGVGAIMVLCNEIYLKKLIEMKIDIVDLTCNQNFQNTFIKSLGFPPCPK
ncbi:MAG: DUF4445 domain-containing protein [Desulfobacteraceae bacterium]|nr:DUF4445 domain-containing protein [Desulfobacteraceae bacterium]